MYVCICKAITDKEIRRARADGVDTLFDLQASLGVATCCGSCADTAQSILNEGRGGPSAPQSTRYISSAA
jgi:bacterioferritin-associated ferredoxin